MAITGKDLLEKSKKKKENPITGEDLINRLKAYQSINTDGVDQTYIDTFIKDANDFFSSSEKDYSGVNWSTASSLFDSKSTSSQDLITRADTIGAWLLKNRNTLNDESYSSLSKALSEYRSGISSVVNSFKSERDLYAQFDTEDAYNAWYEDYLKTTAQDGKYAEMAKSEQGKIGWEKYLADVEATEKAKAEKEASKPWWEKLLGYYGNAGIGDTSMPMGNVPQVVDDVRNGAGLSDSDPRDTWTDEQKRVYGYLYQESKAEAASYARTINAYNAKYAEEEALRKIAEASTSSGWGMLGNTIGAIATAPLGMGDFLSNLVNVNAGKEIKEYDGGVSPFEYSQAVTEGIGGYLNEYGTLDESIPIIGGKGWGDVYSLGTSILQSAASGYALGGVGTLVAYFGQGAAAGIDDAKKRGASDAQAVGYGVLLGLFEGVAESIGIDNLFKLSNSRTVKELIKNILKQAGAEGLEEGFTSIASNIADAWIMQDKSNFNIALQEYMSSGMSESDAKWKVFWDSIEGIVYDTLGGAISGGVHAGFHTAITNALYNKSASKHGQYLINKGGVDNLRALANEMAGVSDDVDALSQKVTTKATSTNVGKLSYALGNAVSSQNLTEVTNALVEKGLSQKEAAKVAERLVNKEGLSKKQMSNDAIRAVAEEVVNNPASAMNERKAKFRNAQLGVKTNASGTEVAVNKKVDVKDRVSADGVTKQVSTGEAITIDKSNPIAKTKDGKVYFNTNKGVVESSDVSYASEDEGLIYEAFVDLNPGFANAIIKNYDGKMPVQKYIQGMREGVVLYGRHNFQGIGKDISNATYFAELSEADQAFALKLGRNYATHEAKVADAPLRQAIKNAAERAKAEGASNTEGTKKTAKSGNVRFENGVKASKDIKKSVELAKVIARAIGTDIVFYDARVTKDKEGKGANGYYDPDTNTIHLDIQKAKTDTHTIAFTLSHELVHWMKKNSATDFNNFAKFLMEQYAGHGINTSELLQKKMDELNTRDADYAFEEMICDACETLLLDSNAVAKLQMLREQDLTLFEKIKLHIRNLLDKLRAEYKKLGYDHTTDEAKALLSMTDVLEQIYEKFEDAMVGAAKNSEVMENLEAVQNSNKTVFGEASLDVKTVESGVKNQLKAHRKTGEASIAYNDKHKNVQKAILQVGVEAMYEMAETMLPYLEQDGILPPDIPGKTIFKNGSYGKTGENTTLCVRTLTYEDFKDRVAEKVGRPLTVSESLLVSQKIYDIATEPQCIYCYVAADRKAYDEYLGEYHKAMDKYIKALRNGGDSKALYTEYLAGRKDTDAQKKRWSQWEAIAKSGKEYISASDLTTKRKRDHIIAKKNAFSEQIKDAQRYAQSASWAKTVCDYRAYKGDILKMTSKFVDMLNSEYGLRMYSFSDYTPAFIVENMQMIIDASVKGLKSLAYTKDTDYVEIFASTGQAINVSCFARWDAELGTFVEDNRQGANWEKTKSLRKQYRNVGAVMVATNDAMVEWALKQDWIDVVIPYHIVKTGTTIANEYQWNNYTSESSDKSGNRAANIYPTEHNNDFATYSDLLNERGITPRFSRWYDMVASGEITEAQYMKLVNEVRLPASELSPVVPRFNLDAAKRSFGVDNDGNVIKGGFVDKGGYMGGWYRQGVDVNQEVMAVSEDINAGKTSLEVDYGMSKSAKEKVEQRYVKKQAKKQDISEKGLSYNSLVALPDLVGSALGSTQQVKLTSDGKIDDTWLCSKVFEQCEAIKTKSSSPTYYIFSESLDKNIEITTDGIRHGYIASRAKKKPATPKEIENARAALNLHDLLRTAIVVNLSEKHTNFDTPFAYVMIGVTRMDTPQGGKEYYAVRMIVQERKNGNPILQEANVLGRLSAINAKKIDLPHPQVGSSGTVALKSGGRFGYSIAHLLADVKYIFPDTFSKDVYKHFQMQRTESKTLSPLKFQKKKDSNGNELSEGQIEFFKDSKVRDEDGRLIPVFHGSEIGGFTIFDNSHSGDAYWFADETTAKSYIDVSAMGEEHWSGKGKTSLYAVYLNAKNPLVIDADGYRAVSIPTNIFPEDGGRSRFHHIDDIAIYAKDNGYDGLIVNNVKDYGMYTEESLGITDDHDLPVGNVYAVFESNQIKNTDNRNPTENKDIRYQKKRESNRTILANALETTIDTSTQAGQNQLKKLQEYKSKIDMLEKEEAHLAEVKQKIHDISFTKGSDRSQLTALNDDKIKTQNRIHILDSQLTRLEAMKPIQDVLAREKEAVRVKTEAKAKEAFDAYKEQIQTVHEADIGRERAVRKEAIAREKRRSQEAKVAHRWEIAELREQIAKLRVEMATAVGEEKRKKWDAIAKLRAEMNEKLAKQKTEMQNSKKEAVANVRETQAKQEAKQKLQKLVLETIDWIEHPAKTDIKCPDMLKAPFHDFLKSINLDSKRALDGGSLTKNDLRIDSAMNSLANKIEKLRENQASDKEGVDGFLDLPGDFVRVLRDMADDITEKMEALGSVNYVVNGGLTANDIKTLTKLIRTLVRSIKTMNTLYANLRFANTQMLGVEAVGFLDSMGKAEKISSIKDFVLWDNGIPYYVFKRFGEAGESVFEEFMDAQDKMAYNAKKILEFRENTWTDKEANEWSNDRHVVRLPRGISINLTTADAMSIYCLSRRNDGNGDKQGMKHLLGGGVRIIGIKKGTSKFADEITNLSEADIDEIIDSLSDRQKQVAEAMQEFMSTVGSAWGNEISMKRFLTKDFVEKIYFPIESDNQNLKAELPEASQGDLYRLLNISATKSTNKYANNRLVVRNIFDVFTNHMSDMAKLNAFGMALLDYMKWVNYKESVTTDAGEIVDRSVRQSMNNTYGDEAIHYVLNLIKDINGRHTDNGDNQFLMKMIRLGKTASVGNNLRVAFLQFTSYPRAAMVLSNKSLAMGLTKVPNLKMAEKYCGIALWKSFGFYDTNIARSIEDQIKGATNIRQKIIELSMTMPGLADAITWGALWNACEYEVSKTTTNTVGSEEFYQEVGKKLREVVYATQVVDSVLTRSQIMRSKSGLTQMATAYMGEPTLTANILMDAGFQFEMEKRISGSPKTAWKKTSKIIIGAVGNYCVLQLLTSLAESLADAWRDDEDEEFDEKFKSAFVENLITNIIPVNKLPIISDIADTILSFFGLGYASSDNMATTWLTQIADAVNVWSEVLGEKLGGEDTSKTAYNAIYKTAKALSAVTGISVSGAMREVVALWNNTAGAYDSTLKLRMYESSNDELGNELYEAILEGNDRQADSLRDEFEDEDAANSAIRKALRDEYKEGNISRSKAMDMLIEHGGLDNDEAYWRLKEWDYYIKNGSNDGYSKYTEFYEAVRTGSNLKTVINEHLTHGADKSDLASQITKYYKPLYKEMSNSERASLKGYLLNAYVQLGYNRTEKSKDIDNWLKD